jgi:nickel/cobalt exporter
MVTRKSPCYWPATIALLLFATTTLLAHPVPKNLHDRVIVVRITPDALLVEFHLEVDEWTVVFKDLPEILKAEELRKLNTPREFYDAFSQNYAAKLAELQVAALDGKELNFTCVKHGYQLKDSLQCDFVFRARWTLSPDKNYRLTYQDITYELEAGRVNLSLAPESALEILERSEPDESLKKRATIDLRPGDDAKLRKLSATFHGKPIEVPELLPMPQAEATPTADPPRTSSLLELVLDPGRSFWILLYLAAILGAGHALTPGHGKTLVAAYLVGERGTVWHAVLLGVVTTLTHTSTVLLLALVLPWFYPGEVPDDVQTGLGILGGLLVAGLGFWLLLRRLTGRADHVHFGGGHHHHHHDGSSHHHHHGPADHTHDEHGHAQPVGLWGLLVLGMHGGLVPCPEALVMFVFAVKAQRLWLALPLLLAFSAGLALVLVVIGILVVRARKLAGSRWEDSRLFKALPIVSAVLVTGLGLWLCYDSLHHR